MPLIIFQRLVKCLLPALLFTGYTAISQHIDTVLKRHEIEYNKNPQRGIQQAKHTYAAAIKNKSIANQLKCLRTITYFYWDAQDFLNAHKYSQKGFQTANSNHIDSLAGDFLMISGILKQVKSDYTGAIAYYNQALTHYTRAGMQKRAANIWINLGICNMKLSRFREATIFFIKAAGVFKKHDDAADLSAAYNSLASCFMALSDIDKGFDYNRKALQLRQRINDTVLVAQSLNNLGYAFYQHGMADSAIHYLSQCLQLRRKVKDSSLLVLTLQNLGAAWKIRGNSKNAAMHIQRSINIAVKYNMNEEIARGELDMAGVYFTQKQFGQALAAVKIAEEKAVELKLPGIIAEAYALKSKIYAATGEYKTALAYETQKNKLKDSLFNIAKSNTIAELEIRYQTREKENDIRALNKQAILQRNLVKQQQTSIILLVTGAVLLLVLLIVLYKGFKAKQKDNERIKMLMHDLHHRVKNNLQMLAGLFTMQISSLNDEKTKLALRENETRLVSMNLVHNKLYNTESYTQINMNAYLGELINHIKNVFSRQSQPVTLQLNLADVYLDADVAVAIGLIVNELATNAFKYAFNTPGGVLTLQLLPTTQNRLYLSMHDNGKGITDAGKETKGSFGLKLVNLMAAQLGSELLYKNVNGSLYELEINLKN